MKISLPHYLKKAAYCDHLGFILFAPLYKVVDVIAFSKLKSKLSVGVLKKCRDLYTFVTSKT